MAIGQNIFKEEANIFNTPLEIGLRILFVLNAIKPRGIDLNRLVIYDYFLLNSSFSTSEEKRTDRNSGESDSNNQRTR